MEYIDEDGVIRTEHEELNRKSDAEQAATDLAAFKFRLFETVAADRRLKKAPCLQAIVVLCGFLKLDKRTLKPNAVYASAITLMSRGSIKSKTSARAARQLLQELGYLQATGSSTKDGCVKYRVANPHVEFVQMSVADAAEHLKGIEAERRRLERIKREEARRGSNIDPTQNARGDNDCPRRGSDIDPKYLRGNLGGISSEKEEPFKGSSALSGYAHNDDDPHQPFPIPESAHELERMMSDILKGADLSSAVIGFFRLSLTAGKLTPAMVEEQRRFAA